MNPHLWYDRQGQPMDTATVNRLLGDMEYKRIAKTNIKSASDPAIDWDVSTVWLGLDHSFGDGPPIIFETMVFGDGDGDQYMQRYATEEQARAGHAETVSLIAATVPDEQIADVPDVPRKEASGSEAAEPELSVGAHLHRWGQWQDGTATYDSPLLPKLGTWKGPVQTRRCGKCGKTEIRKVT